MHSHHNNDIKLRLILISSVVGCDLSCARIASATTMQAAILKIVPQVACQTEYLRVSLLLTTLMLLSRSEQIVRFVYISNCVNLCLVDQTANKITKNSSNCFFVL